MKKIGFGIAISSIVFISAFQLIPMLRADCTNNPQTPTLLPGVTVAAGQTVNWRVRCVDPDYANFPGTPNITPVGVGPLWVQWGTLVVPDVNVYVFAPKDYDCDGNEVDPNISRVASRSFTISPPQNIYGEFYVDIRTTDGNLSSYWRLPITVLPGNRRPLGDGGIDTKK